MEHNEKGPATLAAAAWIARAGELAEWAWSQVNRADVWGGYNPLAERGREYTDRDGNKNKLGKVTTRPLPSARGKVYLTRAHLARHFAATAPEYVVGLHTTSPENLSRWGACEVDQHGDGGNTPEANLAAALAWHAELARRGFRPLLTDSNGAGGYHLRLLLADPVPTPNVFAFLKDLTADYARHALTAPPETFPKQRIIPAGRYGNWLRLPGRHHTREHWSTVWDGSRWLSGADAVAYLVTFTGDPPALVPPEPPPPPRPATRSRPQLSRHGDNLSTRIARYMARLPNLGEGQGRDDVAFLFAAFLLRDLDVSEGIALQWLELWDSRNHPPKGRARLLEIMKNSRTYGQRAVGCGREPGPTPGQPVILPGGRRGHSIIRCEAEVF
jgi:hypothetical protein